jgi:hypothetical protein
MTMAEQSKARKAGEGFAVETQKQRWVKYGANVILSCVIVALLTAFVVYIAGRASWRADTTSSGDYSLKPQSVRLVQNLSQKVKIVGLFTKAEQGQEKKVREESREVRYRQVADLLQEYQAKSGGKVTVEMIDPITEYKKLDDLFNQVAHKYSNDIGKYEEVMKTYPTTLAEINRLAGEESDALEKALPKTGDRKMIQTIGEVQLTVQVFPSLLDSLRDQVKRQLDLKVPDLAGAADAIRQSLTGLIDRADAVLDRFKEMQADAKVPENFKKYMTSAVPRYEQMKKAADELVKKIAGLGEIKQFDELRRNKENSIAVLGETDLRVIPMDSIYQLETGRTPAGEAKLKPRFAAEQQVSTALVALTTRDKKKVAFIRSGGAPLASNGPMGRGPLTEVADRLRAYGMDVMEKDVSGAWAMRAMQMQMQGAPVTPEPTDEQLKDAVWIVLVTPQDPRQMMMNPAASALGPKVSEHLNRGGAAMILVNPQTEKMDFLKEWGIEVKPDYMIVHDRVEGQGAASEDYTSEWQREQPVYFIREYGDHLVTQPLNSLDGLFAFLVPVDTVAAKGVKTTRVLPIPGTPRPWAEADINDPGADDKPLTFDPKKEPRPDLPGPLWAGAIAEREDGKGRLIVLGSLTFALDAYVNMRDRPASQAQGRFVARFPGNGELFTNGVFWLARMDGMIAMSPRALETPRVAPMKEGVRDFLRVGLMIILLPLGAVATGALVYLKRRD